jgi:predicted 3-demethylubiquinone-9 3-methyltransferase (glyoxalase superfamily)
MRCDDDERTSAMATIGRITPCLWFDTRAEEAATFYTGIFEDSRIVEVTRYGKVGPGPEGTVMTVRFQLAGHEFVALNGGPEFTFSEAVSFQVRCDSQEEVDRFWSLLSDGGVESMCGWLKDRFGLSWQIVPAALLDLVTDPDEERAQRAFQAMLGMRKIDIAELHRAADAV